MYSCDQCASRFTRRFNLTRHKDGRCEPITVIKGLVREVSSNDIGEQDVPRKRLLNDSAELNAADKINKPFKNPKIQSLLDEIINDSSTEKSLSTISQAIQQNAPVIKKKIPKPPPEIVAELFPFEPSKRVLPKPSPEVVAAVFQEKEQPEELAVESTPRTTGDII